MREPRYSILSDINDGIDRAKQGKLALYWQRNIEHEYRCKKVTPAEQQAYTDLQDILAAVPQWSDEEELRSGMEGIGGRVWFCYFWEEHDSMVQLTEDCSGKFTVAYVLDSDVTPEVRKAAAQHAQQQLAECMQEWDVPLMKSAIPEKDKFSGFHPSSALRRLTHRLRWLTASRPSILTRPSNRPLRTPGALRT